MEGLMMMFLQAWRGFLTWRGFSEMEGWLILQYYMYFFGTTAYLAH